MSGPAASRAEGPVDPDVAEVVDALRQRVEALPARSAYRRTFLEVYLRTTEAVGRAVAAGGFEDPDWVRRWDVTFAGLFLAAHDADESGTTVPRPWRLAFAADPALPPLVHVLVELNAHVNWDLPQAILAVIDDADLASEPLVASRVRDHDRINAVLAGRTVAEGRLLNGGLGGTVMIPVNTWLTHRFLPRAREQAWHNVLALAEGRRQGPEAYAARLRDLDTLASAKVTELLEPRWALPRVTVRGFGVTVPPA
ncbi:DUF5995 family protein [Microlunatus flavus]|uniref:Uncharacterized protein n=1 Tax=Microlunatus flavus TaxID=1036181 RepID=A0A1H9A615_9ACTN|nr:DUF5995 family protein [Microlunatus flavus]SEP71923.1 hypothetical protein SAMN05421756_101482 [Microlunatus flavus]